MSAVGRVWGQNNVVKSSSWIEKAIWEELSYFSESPQEAGAGLVRLDL
jgi:hypothetical protein